MQPINLNEYSFQRIYDEEQDKNRGWICHKISCILGQVELGYIKITYIPLERFKIHYTCIQDFLYRIKGRRADANYKVNIKDYNDFCSFKKYHVDYPIVDFIRVYDKYQRQGIGTQLYIEAAKYMEELGFVLRSSTLQSSAAESVWKSMSKKGIARMIPKRNVDQGRRYVINKEIYNRKQVA